jgi:glucans biosynthesis protein C
MDGRTPWAALVGVRAVGALLPQLPRRRTPPPVRPDESRCPTAGEGDRAEATGGSAAPPRFHDLDALRGLLMILGVVLHAALVYSTQAEWVVSDPQQSPAFDTVYAAIHAFRLPTFFLISGLLCAAGIGAGPGRFLKSRGVRLAVPLVATAVLVNPVQVVLVSGPAAFWEEFAGGRWVGHLWFLIDLLAYTVLAAGVRAVCPRVLAWRPPAFGGAVVLVVPLVTAGVRWACDRWLSPGPVLDLGEMLYHLPFFVFGLWYLRDRDGARLRRLAGWAAVVLPVAAVGPLDHLPGGSLYTDAATSWAASLLCLHLGRRLFDRPWRLTRALGEASYTVYLFHQLAVVALALVLLPEGLPAGVKFAAVVVGGFAGPLALHVCLVRRTAVLRFLFNGYRPRRAAAHPD